MTKRIFKAICIGSIAVFLATLLMILGVLYEYFSAVQQKQLRIETDLAARGIEQSGAAYFEELDTEGYRISWIASDGRVLYDSSTDSSGMENHMERKEINAAIETGYGESVRYSSTLMQRSIYCAKRMEDGTIVRVSVLQGTVLLLLIGMLQPIMVIVIIGAILSFVLASKLSKRIVEPMNHLNLNTPLENDEYEELAPVLRRINSQQIQLRQQSAILQQKQNELNTIVGNMQEGMALLDGNGRIIVINKSARALLNSANIAVGSEFLEATRNQDVLKAVSTAMKGENTSVYTELDKKRIQVSVAPVTADEQVSGIAIVFFDITEREKSEQQRREFTANVSHELKTPLHAISGYAELLKCGMVDSEHITPFAEKIYDETQRLITLVEDIIELSKLDEKRDIRLQSDVDLYEVAKNVVGSLSTLSAECGVSIRVEGKHGLIRGVPELIHGIVYNLCDNAIKYNRRGGEVVVCAADNLLTVRDTGIGISREHIDRIFERFYRVDKGRSKAVGGTGLGLSIVKHAAMIHDARITIESEVGKGTSISVQFPETSVPADS